MASRPVTDAEFDQNVLKSNQPVLVDFWAEWCGPCRSLGPKLEEISNEMAERLQVLKLNVDENPQAAARYGVRGIPTMILFKEGKDVEQLIGNQPKENIVAMLTKHL